MGKKQWLWLLVAFVPIIIFAVGVSWFEKPKGDFSKELQTTLLETRCPRQVITFHLPFAGEADLPKCVPSHRIVWSTEVDISRGEIRFDLVNWNDNAEELKSDQSHIIENIRRQNQYVTNEVEQFNSSLDGHLPIAHTSQRIVEC